jgi:hypothetical protein
MVSNQRFRLSEISRRRYSLKEMSITRVTRNLYFFAVAPMPCSLEMKNFWLKLVNITSQKRTIQLFLGIQARLYTHTVLYTIILKSLLSHLSTNKWIYTTRKVE